jgi:hypothetical protein
MRIDFPHNFIDHNICHTHTVIFEPTNKKPKHPGTCLGLENPKHQGAMRFELIVSECIVDKIASLADNWDGYGANKIAQETAHNTKVALSRLYKFAPIPEMTPNPNGTISLEWESNQGFAHLEIGLKSFSFYIKPRYGQPLLADGNADSIDADLGRWIAVMLYPTQSGAETITKISYSNNVLRHTY